MTRPNNDDFFGGFAETANEALGQLAEAQSKLGAPPGGIQSGVPGVDTPDPTRFPDERPPWWEQVPNALIGPPEGRERLAEVLKDNPHKPGSRQYDDWIVAIQPDPQDPAFNSALRAIQGPAHRRRTLRAEQGEPMKAQELERQLELDRAEEESGPVTPKLPEHPGGTLRPEVKVLGPDGEPLPEQYIMLPDGSIVLYHAGVADDVSEERQIGTRALETGEYVWMGDMGGTVEITGQDREATRGAYMGAEAAIMLPYHWTPEQISYAQEALGLEQTGFVDPDLINGWSSIVQASAGYTQAGRKFDPFMLLDMTFEATQAAGRGGGGGGGGAAGPAWDRTHAAGFLNAAMMEEAGREATDEEIGAFLGVLQGAGMDVDPQQLAVDWLRGQVGEEAGAYQVATDYYEAMLQVLGARTQAEEPNEVV